MDISSKFSLVDFLAYLFPGFVSTLGLYLLFLLTPLNSLLISVSLDLFTGLLILTLSYVIGVVLSGFAEISVRYIAERQEKVWVKRTIPIPGFQKEIIAAFNDIFREVNSDKETEWSATCFHLCRSLVFEFMPGLAQTIQRQSSLRQLRMNLLPAVTIWAVAGIAWGIYLVNVQVSGWGYGLIVGTLILWVPIVRSISNRMNRNEKRETREVLTAFLAGYKKGLFKQTEK
ncbi:MAG: hypothetical protein GY797_11880 [Deltaproteobacteria bacterium]|nr:hypothetical protein [Deltaproteobacteria bacterium]